MFCEEMWISNETVNKGTLVFCLIHCVGNCVSRNCVTGFGWWTQHNDNFVVNRCCILFSFFQFIPLVRVACVTFFFSFLLFWWIFFILLLLWQLFICLFAWIKTWKSMWWYFDLALLPRTAQITKDAVCNDVRCL